MSQRYLTCVCSLNDRDCVESRLDGLSTMEAEVICRCFSDKSLVVERINGEQVCRKELDHKVIDCSFCYIGGLVFLIVLCSNNELVVYGKACGFKEIVRWTIFSNSPPTCMVMDKTNGTEGDFALISVGFYDGTVQVGVLHYDPLQDQLVFRFESVVNQGFKSKSVAFQAFVKETSQLGQTNETSIRLLFIQRSDGKVDVLKILPLLCENDTSSVALLFDTFASFSTLDNPSCFATTRLT